MCSTFIFYCIHGICNLKCTKSNCINNRAIDYSYEYKNSYSNTGGKNFYVITVKAPEKSDLAVTGIEIGGYSTTWGGARSHPHALRVQVTNISAYIYRNSGGEYISEFGLFVNENFNDAILIIDPDTATVIDMQMPNWYYAFGYRTNDFRSYQRLPL